MFKKKRSVSLLLMGMLIALSSLFPVLSFPAEANAATVIELDKAWKFKTDPDRIGESQGWQAENYDDSAWQTLLSGQPWESQGVDYAGFAWYRQKLEVPAADAGAPLTVKLAAITSDDDFYFNGVRVGGLKGEYKYNNLKLRTYTIPASLIHFGQPNTIAIRLWGGNIGFEGKKSGLIAGDYQAVLDRYQVMARPVGGAVQDEVPVSLWDLSNAQRGEAFELVYRLDPELLADSPAHFQYALTDFARTPILSGTVPILTGSDGLKRAVIVVDASSSRQLYLSGRFKIEWQFADANAADWADTGDELILRESASISFPLRIYKKSFPAGPVSLPADGDSANHNMYAVMAKSSGGALTISDLSVADTANAADWSIQPPFNIGDKAYGDRAYTFSGIPAAYVGTQRIMTANDSKSFKAGPVAVFQIDQPAEVYIAVDRRVGKLPWVKAVSVDHLNFALRDQLVLSELPTTIESTPYGNLKLIDRIDAATPLAEEIHPYMQGGFSSEQKNNTPGSGVNVTVQAILGKQARESDYGWFAYRIGRGQLTPGSNYLLRIEYPEDKPRYAPIEIQTGRNYMDVGWRNGISPTDVYDNWPLSQAWQYYDVVVPLGEETTASGGAGDGDGKDGFWVYFMNKIKPGNTFSLYSGGPAIATVSLYEIDADVHAPALRLPDGLPQRTLMFDWERQPTQNPQALVDYAKLMGYSAIAPITLKWAFGNYGDPLAGYDATNVDDRNYWVSTPYTPGSGQTPSPAVANKPSVHQQYLEATRHSGVDYIPRFEYGGSYDLPEAARAIGADGAIAKPNRFANWGANLLHGATWNDLETYVSSLLQPHVAANPQLTGALWRIRSDRMQISYGLQDIAMFCAETQTAQPAGLTAAQLAGWASTGEVGKAYSAWWQGKRAAFHQKLVQLLQSYRPDLTLYYYNWDQDKFSLLRPDLNQWAFIDQINSKGGAAAYAEDRSARAADTAEDYINAIREGDFTGPAGVKRPDYALNPALYREMPGIQLLAPVNALPYANKPDYINYFQTADGLAVTNIMSYDEIASRYINPKYETNMITPAGGPFSLSNELLSYYYGDARTLTHTSYTFGRGFADAHRRFAQAFRALPAVPGSVVPDTPANSIARTYATANGTYVGVAYKGYNSAELAVSLPGHWSSSYTVTNLVTNQTVPASVVNGKLQFQLSTGPMELNAFLVASSTTQAPQAPTALTASAGNGEVTLHWMAASETERYQVKRSVTSGGPYTIIASHVTGATYGATVTALTYTDADAGNGATYYYVVSALNAGGEGPNSNEASATPAPPPAAPVSLTATGGAELAVLRWTPVAQAASYTVTRSLSSGGPYATVAEGVYGDSYTNKGLTGDVAYYYRVQAAGVGGLSLPSNEASVTPLPVPVAPANLSASADIGRIQLNWLPVNGAVSYQIKRSLAPEGPYASLAADVTSAAYEDAGLAAGLTYYYKVSALNSYGIVGVDSASVSAAPVASMTVSMTSVAAHDGYIVESNKGSQIGGTISSGTLRAGDTFKNAQIKSFLSFDTSLLPDTAIVRSAGLKLRRSGGITGTNPFETHGALHVDVKGGAGFNNSLLMENEDFAAAADAVQIAELSDPVANLNESSGTLSQGGLHFINPTGHTQFRLYFDLHDNGNASNDYLNWYPGDSSTVANRPVLTLTYDLGAIPTGLSSIAGSKQAALSWTATELASSYNVKRSLVRGGPYTTVATAISGTSWTDTGLADGQTYYYVVSANENGQESPNSAETAVVVEGEPATALFQSEAAYDGYVMESGENTGIGGLVSTTNIRAGDHSNNNQFKGILSFDTSTLPDNAVIQSAVLKLRRASVTGTNPFETHGELYADLKGGTGFGGALSLESSDFEAQADVEQAAVLGNAAVNLDWSAGTLSPSSLSTINKSGSTQFRVYFATDDNNDGGSDYMNWYSGEQSTAAYRPVLEIVYR